jgi:hypothetical protein
MEFGFYRKERREQRLPQKSSRGAKKGGLLFAPSEPFLRLK